MRIPSLLQPSLPTLAFLIASTLAAKVDFSGLPDCAVVCISEALATQGCANQECACELSKNAAIISSVGPCLIENCTPDELNQSLAANEQLCGGTSNSTTSATTSATSNISTASTDASDATASSPGGKNNNNGGTTTGLEKLAIGLGVGLGLSVLIIIAVGLTFYLRKRKREKYGSELGSSIPGADGGVTVVGLGRHHELDGSHVFSQELSTISYKGTPRSRERVDGEQRMRSELPG